MKTISLLYFSQVVAVAQWGVMEGNVISHFNNSESANS